MKKVNFPIKIPMKEKQVRLIKDGKKWLTLRNIQYDDYPYRKRKIIVPDDLTEEIVIGEGYQSKEDLMKALRSMRHRKFPKEMWLYDLRYEV
jgi:hypothetical protein